MRAASARQAPAFADGMRAASARQAPAFADGLRAASARQAALCQERRLSCGLAPADVRAWGGGYPAPQQERRDPLPDGTVLDDGGPQALRLRLPDSSRRPSGPSRARRRVALSAALVALAGLAFDASFQSPVRTERVRLLAGARPARGGLVRVEAPGHAALRGTLGVVTAEVVNGPSRAERIGLRLDGVERVRADVAPGATARLTFVPSAGTMRALAGESGAAAAFDLAGQGSDWRATRLDISTAYWTAGRAAALVPAAAPRRPPARAAAWPALVLLGVAGAVWRLGFRTPAARRAHRAAAVPAIAVLLAAALLPLLTPVRLLMSPPVFWAAALAPLAAALWTAAGLSWRLVRTAGGAARRGARAGAAAWRRYPVAAGRAAALLGLVALAVCQPLYDVLRDSPEFFVARNTSASTALLAAAALGLGLPLVLLAVERALARLSPAAATALFHAYVAVLVALVVHPGLRRGEVAGPWAMAALSAAAGGLVSMAAWRLAPVRQMLAALGPAAIVVPALFFGSRDVGDSLIRSAASHPAPVLAATPPIVLVVFDEFPLLSLLQADGTIDAARYPHLAALSREATWFREATAVSSQTVWAVPAIASGRYPVELNAVPTLRYYPDNLFTLLAGRYEMFVFGRFLQLCPPEACHRDLEGPGDGPLPLLADLAVVWLHIVAPGPLAERLPPVVGDWMGFARAGLWRDDGRRRVRNDRGDEFARFLAAMDARPARLYFLHSLLPHMPFEYVPSGRRYVGPDFQGRVERGAGLFLRVDRAYADAAQQRHLLQVGFVDTLVGRLVAHLRGLGVYDRTLLVVTADHGASYREGVSRRNPRDNNLADIIRVPLFVKLPGQRRGGPVDGVAESVDVLPTIAAALGMPLPFDADGRALLDPAAPAPRAPTFISRSRVRVTRQRAGHWRASSRASLARRLERFPAGSDGALYAVPGTESLLGARTDSLRVGAGAVTVDFAGRSIFDDVDTSADVLPLHVRGALSAPVTAPIAVAVNGRIVATTEPYEERGALIFSTMIPEAALADGRNHLAAFVLEPASGGPRLTALTER